VFAFRVYRRVPSSSTDYRAEIVADEVYTDKLWRMFSQSTITGDVFANQAFFDPQTLIDGDATLGVIQEGAGFVDVTGTLTTGVTTVIPTVAPMSFSPGSGVTYIDFDQETALAPGAFDTVVARARSKVTLTAGVYEASAFVTESDVEVVFDVSDGSIELIADSVLLDYRNDISIVGGSADDVIIYGRGVVKLGSDSTLAGTVVSQGVIQIQERAVVNGCARTSWVIEMFADSAIVQQ
jgi:hypothetical protein